MSRTWLVFLGLVSACDLSNVVATPIAAQAQTAPGAPTPSESAATPPTAAPPPGAATAGSEIPLVRERPRGSIDLYRLESLAPRVVAWNDPRTRLRELMEIGRQKGCSAILFDSRQWILDKVGEEIESGVLVSVGGSNASSLQFKGLRGVCLRLEGALTSAK